MKKILVSILLSMVLMIGFVACQKGGSDSGEKESQGKTYQYKETSLTSIQVYQMKTKKRECILSLRPVANVDQYDFDHIDGVVCYDQDCNEINEEWDFSYDGDELTIRGSKAGAISGIAFTSGQRSIYLRYLDSDQYAILIKGLYDDTARGEYEETLEGDEDLYRTAEEKAVLEKGHKEAQERFSHISGKWVATDGSYYRFFYEEEKDQYRMASGNNGTEEETTPDLISSFAIKEQDGTKILEVGVSGDPGERFTFKFSDDMKSLQEEYSDDKVYVRED